MSKGNERRADMDANEHITVERECGSFAKNATSEIEGRLTNVRGVLCADVRTFVPNAHGEMVPTTRGLCIGREKLPELLALVERMIETCQECAAGAKG